VLECWAQVEVWQEAGRERAGVDCAEGELLGQTRVVVRMEVGPGEDEGGKISETVEGRVK
jgi:hypothetical protein